ncbi:MAG: 23S rRNA (adenine(1618)-N(6))-methyltransferase [Gallionellales bacterium RIFOXYB12_FULL_54_9]|nr:MAG: 23S rRNA (adenine(1618)-N(6))-methyltransferase [Gallionellales bacterium RIFOXYB12_FULL_54_9]
MRKFHVKAGLHPRNLHRNRYDFKRLITASPQLASFVSVNAYGDESIDFTNPLAVRAINRALLIHHYGIQGWDIPQRYLCPPIPGRADYLHYLADLLGQTDKRAEDVRVLDIGTGANCIYPLIGNRVYGWQFVGSDIDPAALANAQGILDANPGLNEAVELRLQTSCKKIFPGVVQADEVFDLVMCNPPFHSSLIEATAGTQRKWRNLGKKTSQALNFGGQGAELWCHGGEEAFVCEMIAESVAVNSRWFTSLISKSASLPGVYHALKHARVIGSRTIEMTQGQKKSRLIAWTFQDIG